MIISLAQFQRRKESSAPPAEAPSSAHTPGVAALCRRWADPAAVALATVLIAWRASTLGQWIVDDAAITFAYARSIDEGLGPVQQPGADPVEGYSNPSWLALLLVGRRLGLFDHGALLGVSDLVLYPKALALLCTAGVLACVAAAARAVLPGRAWAVTLLTGAVLAGNLSYVAWSFSGLENPLYALTAAATGALLVRGAARGALLRPTIAASAGAIALLAALTRPDGAVLAAAYPVTVLLFLRRDGIARAVRAAALSCGTFALPYGAFLLWRRATFGLWVPNTAVAKAQKPPGLAQLSSAGELLGYGGWALALIGAACVGTALARPGLARPGLARPGPARPGLARPGPARRALAALLVPLALTLLAYGVLGRDWMALYRFATPVWVLAATALSLAAVTVWQAERLRARVLIGCALAGALLLSVTGQAAQNGRFVQRPTLSMCFVAERYGHTFNAYAAYLGLRDATVALPDLGGTLLTSRLRVVDVAGLTDRRVAEAYAAADTAGLRDYVLNDVRPELLHVHAAWTRKTGLTVPRLAAAGYVPLYREGDGGDFVRADAVRDPARIAALRERVRPALDDMVAEMRPAGCGPALRAGEGSPA
ncbi:hypothetical protein GCM10009837_77660 [Streptomyces durmitorensis]|uniref:Glycosyltransferase RgtA/B/C/D-like domain-containing protein n=1 Tax=Streptomyces durmitorensis TaxID=319947 RepID=A0ABY4PWK7_9ACTN|nr:hypothetical protein [Streptomyces durmitorensis]UQT58217.1 hypothetical protein M4V62_25770 [Streptomyces durmitorensis]